MKKILTAALFLFLAAPAGAASSRTFDALTDKELDGLSTITRNYYTCVASRLNTVAGADDSTAERIMATYPPHIKILRQDCRVNLVLVEKYLYGLNLNPEFIHNYANTLRDDVVYYALKEKLRLKKAAADEAGEEAAEKKRRQEFDARRSPAPGNGTEKPVVIPGLTPPSGYAPQPQQPVQAPAQTPTVR